MPAPAPGTAGWEPARRSYRQLVADEGLVTRKDCEMDRRGFYACVTDKGREVLADAEPTQHEVLARTLSA